MDQDGENTNGPVCVSRMSSDDEEAILPQLGVSSSENPLLNLNPSQHMIMKMSQRINWIPRTMMTKICQRKQKFGVHEWLG